MHHQISTATPKESKSWIEENQVHHTKHLEDPQFMWRFDVWELLLLFYGHAHMGLLESVGESGTWRPSEQAMFPPISSSWSLSHPFSHSLTFLSSHSISSSDTVKPTRHVFISCSKIGQCSF